MKAATETQTSKTNDSEKSAWSKFCQKRGVNSNLILLKLTLFVMHGATASLLPYLTIHMRSVGLTVEEIAVIYLALPFTTFIAPPVTGFLVDKFGKYKPVVILTFLLNALFHHSLYLIPQQEIPGVTPAAYVMRHPHNGNVEVWWSPCPSRECSKDEEINIVVDTCIDHCLLLEQNPKIEVVQKPTKSPTIRLNSKDDLDDLNFKVSKKKLGTDKNIQPNTETTADLQVLSSDEVAANKTIRNETVVEVEEESEESWVAGSGEAAFFLLDMHPDLGEAIEHMGIEIEEDEDLKVTDFNQRFGDNLLWEKGVNVTELEDADLRCGGLVLQHNITISEERLRELSEDCMVQKCEFLSGGPDVCPPEYMESDDKTFWIYFALRLLGTLMLSGGITMMDPIALAMVDKHGGDFGRERLFSMFGMAIFSPITGIMIDYCSSGLEYTDYSSAFYIYDALLIISCITVIIMPLDDKLPAENLFRDMWNLLKMPRVFCFIFFLFVLGNFWGFIESFLFIYLQELGAPNILLGFTITVGTISSVPFLYTAEKITRIFGHVNLIVIAFFSHACRLTGYSFIDNAWWCFPFEAMEAFSCHLMWVAAATYCAVLAPQNLLATLIGVLGMAHFSLGRGSGSFFGGLLIGTVGTRETFRYMGIVALTGGISYKIIHILWLKKFDLIPSQDDDEMENGEGDKLSSEPKTRECGTSMSQERLASSLMINKYNQMGSMTSLPRGSRTDLESIARRRSSYTISNAKAGSASKVDLLKSALEINNKISHPFRKDGKSSNPSLRSPLAGSDPKLFNHHHSKSGSIDYTDQDKSRRDSVPEEEMEKRTSVREMTPIEEVEKILTMDELDGTSGDHPAEAKKSSD